MRPLRSFLLLLFFLATLAGLFFVFPSSGIFPAPEVFIPILRTGKLKVSTEANQDTMAGWKPDTSAIITRDSLSSCLLPSPREHSYAPDPLKPFLDSLNTSGGQVRIMYYGDSQVEGDRITFHLRELLRKGRGGTGPGLFLPVMPVMYSKSVWLRASPNWKRYNYLSWKNGEISHNNLGPFMAVCRYLPEKTVSEIPQKAYLRIRPSNFADSASSTYEILRIFYSNTNGEVNLMVRADNRIIFADTLESGSGMNEISCAAGRSREILIEFEGNVSPDIYGLSIESRKGIIVDNIPQRGSAGLEFTMVGRDNLKDSYRLLSPDLIILHYGLNIVRNVRNEYSYYARGLQRQITLLKEIAPSTPVLVIGVTDMAEREGDSIISYRNIPAIVESQREAALKSGAAFWDSYHAMGGKSSVITWAEKRPPLAQKDYVHFTYPGADTLSKLLANAMFSAVAADTPVAPDTIPKSLSGSTSGTSPEISNPAGPRLIVSVINRIFSYDPENPFIFTSPSFWLFFLVVMLGLSLVYRRHFLRNFYLLLVSLFFYYKSGGLFLSLLILVSAIDFLCGLLIYRSGKKIYKRIFILVSIISNLSLLAYFKYTGFLISTINDVFGTAIPVYDFLASFSNLHLGTSFDVTSIILPVGISFFTFQSMSYTLDVYRGKLEPVRNIIDFGFYVSFFPQLVAGPIVRASEFIPQLYNDYSLSKREFGHALFLVMKGLIKKIVISDFIAVNFVDRVFDMPSVYSGFENLMAVYGYGLQIYCDFSGYTDIAIGLGLIMGFRLPLNFNSPYKAAGIDDFWKRWHISLSRWLKDYLYISLGGNRKGRFRTGLNLIITMLLGGLWHGASMKFIIWGGLHGTGLVLNKIWNSVAGRHIKSGRFGRVLAIFLTFNFVSFCWIFFRAHDMSYVSAMLRQIFQNFSPGSYTTVIPAYGGVFVLMAIGYLIHFLPEKVRESYRGLFINIPLAAQMAVVLMIAVFLLQMRTTDIMPFIYFRF